MRYTIWALVALLAASGCLETPNELDSLVGVNGIQYEAAVVDSTDQWRIEVTVTNRGADPVEFSVTGCSIYPEFLEEKDGELVWPEDITLISCIACCPDEFTLAPGESHVIGSSRPADAVTREALAGRSYWVQAVINTPIHAEMEGPLRIGAGQVTFSQ